MNNVVLQPPRGHPADQANSHSPHMSHTSNHSAGRPTDQPSHRPSSSDTDSSFGTSESSITSSTPGQRPLAPSSKPNCATVQATSNSASASASTPASISSSTPASSSGSAPPIRRGPWSQEEDAKLLQLIKTLGASNWVKISAALGSRNAKQCRERYHQNLKPTLNHAPISEEEGILIEQLVARYGKRWAEIARHLKGRSDNTVKNWWNGGANRRRRSSLADATDGSSARHGSPTAESLRAGRHASVGPKLLSTRRLRTPSATAPLRHTRRAASTSGAAVPLPLLPGAPLPSPDDGPPWNSAQPMFNIDIFAKPATGNGATGPPTSALDPRAPLLPPLLPGSAGASGPPGVSGVSGPPGFPAPPNAGFPPRMTAGPMLATPPFAAHSRRSSSVSMDPQFALDGTAGFCDGPLSASSSKRNSIFSTSSASNSAGSPSLVTPQSRRTSAFAIPPVVPGAPGAPGAQGAQGAQGTDLLFPLATKPVPLGDAGSAATLKRYSLSGPAFGAGFGGVNGAGGASAVSGVELPHISSIMQPHASAAPQRHSFSAASGSGCATEVLPPIRVPEPKKEETEAEAVAAAAILMNCTGKK